MIGLTQDGKKRAYLIEWKYTETYAREDKYKTERGAFMTNSSVRTIPHSSPSTQGRSISNPSTNSCVKRSSDGN